MTNRGIVVSTRYTRPIVSGYGPLSKSVSFDTRLDPISLRQYLLYWDKVDFPRNSTVSLFGGIECEYLEDKGIVERTYVDLDDSVSFDESFLVAQQIAWRMRNKEEPGCWSMAQPSDFLLLPECDTEERRLVEVELYSAVPVPTPETDLRDILEFKENRKDELIAFRLAMDEAYERVISSRDVPRSKVREIDNLEKKLGDLNKVFAEKWSKRLLSTVKIELNIPNVFAGAVTGAAVAFPLGLHEVGAIVGSILSMIKFDVKKAKVSKHIPAELKDYAYLHSIESELNSKLR